MAETYKVHDLATELDVSNKEILQRLRELGVQVKSHMSSVEQEDVDKLRDAFAQKSATGEVVRREVQPGVIVRRRRRGRGKKQEAQEEPINAETVEGTDGEAEAVAPAAPPQREDTAAEDTAAAPAEEPSKPASRTTAKKTSKRKGAKTDAPVARIISRPEDEIAEQEASTPEPELEEETAAPEAPASATPQAEPEAKDKAAAPDTTEDGKQAASPVEEPQEQEQAVADQPEKEADAESPAAEEKKAKAPSKDGAEKKSKAEDQDKGKKTAKQQKKKKKRSVQEAPTVRVISRPDPAEVARQAALREARDKYLPPVPAATQPTKENGAPVPPTSDAGARRKKKKDRRTVEFNRYDDNQRGKKFNDNFGGRGGKRKKGRRRQEESAPAAKNTQPLKAAKRKLRVDDTVRLSDMAKQMGVKAQDLIKTLFGLGVMATINQSLDFDTASVLAAEFGYEAENVAFDEQEYLLPPEEDSPDSLKPRAPVVTIMGHVDHGKTSLLDAIRKTNVTGGEAGGITQHIGAYHVKTGRGEIVFLDTPGHEAFTTMRKRGAQVTDIVILVVAADDGVMDQTREAVSHAKAAQVPIVVAVNKIDKEGSNPDRVMRELSDLGLVPEAWGGETIFANVSAKQHTGLDELLEMVLLQAEVLQLQANPDKPGRGHVVEAKLDKGRGPVGTVLISEGTIRQSDSFVCGMVHGKIRAMFTDQGQKIQEAGPSTPVEIQGFDTIAEAGDEFVVVADDKVAKRIASIRLGKHRDKELAGKAKVTLESFLASRPENEAQDLNLIVKADVQGSLEAVTEALGKLSTDEIHVHVRHGGTGAITESDILLASASDAIIIGFNIRPEARIKDVADQENVEIRFYDIIYKLTNEVKDAMSGMLTPDTVEDYLGQAEVRDTFSVPKVGTVAGCMVVQGKLTRNAKVRLLRDGVVVYTGTLSSLKRFKDDAKEVAKDFECGVGLERFNDVKVGDIIEAFEEREVARTID
ncbi:translation initiation factor IF-2 [Paucidesulfovibrio gracilis DSM 16080]|uniref:Translation initiation factor IF-2 n=1 Tax=Paucidesulfovibrio gracilis DSM 16080 TaxID=1121449 RepID=A0A1T4XBF3_9BACT|nr:translation initiation factor IF-2 [Paucidesulfovibrio gracilis]SKA86488.1 translation initiation factor IF-2 [Paucidesulfovibrio gracilis DSM 16080]